MGKRVILKIDRDGIVVEEKPSRGGTTAERFESLIEDVTKDVGVGKITMAMRCDRCRKIIRIDDPELPPEWISTAEGDFCPDCR